MTQDQAYNKIEAHFRNNQERFTKRFSRYFNSKERAEDTVSETYTRALTYWNNAPEDDIEFEKWMRTILNNCGKNNHKEEMLHGCTNNAEDVEEEGSEPNTVPTIILADVVKLIESYEQPTQMVLKLALLEGWKHNAIVDVTGLKLMAVRKTVFEFRKLVRDKFKWSI
jgi:DNA-directed RNA polymerase specialized sigma24 family protein